MFSTRDWVTIVVVGLVGAAVIMTLRVVFFALRIALAIAWQGISVFVVCALVAAVVVWVMRQRSGGQ